MIIPGNAGERVSCGCRDDGDLIITRVNFEEEIALQLENTENTGFKQKKVHLLGADDKC